MKFWKVANSTNCGVADPFRHDSIILNPIAGRRLRVSCGPARWTGVVRSGAWWLNRWWAGAFLGAIDTMVTREEFRDAA